MPMRKFGLVAEALASEAYVQIREPKPVQKQDLLRVHSAEYVKAVQTGDPRPLAESQKFPWTEGLYPSVLLTGGGLLAAAQAALTDGSGAALASGFHHSHKERGEGFCTFNGLIVALEALRADQTFGARIQKAAILDMDLHYGNGTARLAAERPWIQAFSIYGNDYWDNTAYRDVTIKKHTDGPNHQSVALPAGCDQKTLLGILGEWLPKLLENGKPDILLYQAGADPYYEDPYSPLSLNHDDLLKRDEAVFRFTKKHQIPIAWVLAGGYTQDISKIVQVHTNTFKAWQNIYE